MILHVIRAIFILAIVALMIPVLANPEVAEKIGVGSKFTVYLLAPLFVGGIVVLVDVLWRRKSLQALSGLFFGLLAGLAIAYVLGLVVQLVADIFPGGAGSPITQMIRVLIYAISVFLCISFVMQTKDDFRFIIPYVEFSKQARGARPILLDTSVIIDGRIADVAATGTLAGQLVIPRFVLNELHAVSDSSDRMRRNRGRRGLDVLAQLRKSDKIDLKITEDHSRTVAETSGVDAKLVVLAKEINGRIMTTDYNLNKVAQLRGVEVLNLNDLANALKTVVLPGERLTVRIIKPGEEAGQGVGYLDDGTMVVVDQARELIGEEVNISITSMLQTSAGKMVFGRLEGAS